MIKFLLVINMESMIFNKDDWFVVKFFAQEIKNVLEISGVIDLKIGAIENKLNGWIGLHYPDHYKLIAWKSNSINFKNFSDFINNVTNNDLLPNNLIIPKDNNPEIKQDYGNEINRYGGIYDPYLACLSGQINRIIKYKFGDLNETQMAYVLHMLFNSLGKGYVYDLYVGEMLENNAKIGLGTLRVLPPGLRLIVKDD